MPFPPPTIVRLNTIVTPPTTPAGPMPLVRALVGSAITTSAHHNTVAQGLAQLALARDTCIDVARQLDGNV